MSLYVQRRTIFLLSTLLLITQLSSGTCSEIDLKIIEAQKAPFQLPPLSYNYDALEPYIQKKTMEIHYNGHHKAYVENLNKALKNTKWEEQTLLQLFENASQLPEGVRNNAGGHWNHCMYWLIMTNDPEKKKMPERLKQEIIATFGSIDAFKERFYSAGMQRFGSGFAWLIRGKDGKLQVTSTPYQDNPLMSDAPNCGKPILGCDVWEHAYYLQYLNKRGDYLNAFWNVVNWEKVDELAYEEPEGLQRVH
jgi:superoxide dismutase, Fe-Mn family